MAGAGLLVWEAGGMSEARGRDSKFATYFTFYKQFLGGWTVSLIQLTLQCAAHFTYRANDFQEINGC
jgi:hypothetical protein